MTTFPSVSPSVICPVNKEPGAERVKVPDTVPSLSVINVIEICRSEGTGGVHSKSAPVVDPDPVMVSPHL
jgi:hypothetical protein